MRIFVLGGDGFCGWPTSLKLAKEGHEVYIIDNMSRRRIDEDGCHKRIEKKGGAKVGSLCECVCGRERESKRIDED